jgi:hypothetical protein
MGTPKSATEPRPHLAVCLLLLLAAIAIVASVSVWFRVISIPHCDLACDGALLTTTSRAYAWSCAAAVVAAAISLVLLRGWRHRWIIPSGAIAAVVIGAVIANHISDVALGFV